MSDAFLTVRDLRKVFRSRRGDSRHQHVAVDGVSFDVPRGSCVAVVGESGSGKTTTARILAGLDTADGGRVDLEGRSILRDGRRPRSRRRPVQMVFQDPFLSLDPRQRVGVGIEELLHITTALDRGRRRARAVDLLDQVGLDDRVAGALPSNLSGGQRQRVAIARALALQPQVLVLDEAVSALDVSVQAQVLNLLNDLRRDSGITYVFVSHDLAVVRQVSDSCVVMRHGAVVEHGDTDGVLTYPREQYTKELIDAVPRPGWRPRSGTR